MFELLNMEF